MKIDILDFISKAIVDLEIVATRVSSTILSALLLSAFLSIVAAALAFSMRRRRKDLPILIGSTSTLAFIAFIAGHLSGNARETVIGDVTPVLLTGVGFLFTLSFIQKEIPISLSGIVTVIFSLSFFMGIQLGVLHREDFLAWKDKMRECKMVREQIITSEPTSLELTTPSNWERNYLISQALIECEKMQRVTKLWSTPIVAVIPPSQGKETNTDQDPE